MTLFGKIVFGITALVVCVGVFYGTTSYVKHDEESAAAAPVVTTATSSQEEATTTLGTASSTNATTSQDKKMAFPLVLERGGKYKCSVIQTMGTITSEGTVYIHDKLVRADFSMSISDQKIDTTMIARGGYIYSWTNTASTTGSKVKMPQAGASSPTGVRTWNGSQVSEYTCDAWKPDDTLFDLPKAIVFIEKV